MAAGRLTFVGLAKKSILFGYKDVFPRGPCSYTVYSKRSFTNVPLEYNDRDPAPLFFSSNIQRLLKCLTRPDLEKVFRRRTNNNEKSLSTPEYKFMTDEELKVEMDKVSVKAEYLLHMPPVIKICDKDDFEISYDPALKGNDSSRFIFTDITFGTRNAERFIVIREPEGQLHHADHDVRKRLNQVYFPMVGRMLKEPSMFVDDVLFQDLLTRKEYEFVLDRACIQYEPDDPTYQRIVSKVYLHCDENKEYDTLRSSRHFGPMTFYLAWNNIIDRLLLDLIQNGVIREAVLLINLQRRLHPGLVESDDSQSLVDEILKTQKNIASKDNNVPTIDADLDEKCIQCVNKYIQNNSSKKSQQELALQAYYQMFKQKQALDEGIRSAHGI